MQSAVFWEAAEESSFAIAINGVKGIYAEYQESGNGARALGAGIYDAIMTVFEPKTYNTYVKNEIIEDALGAFTDFFSPDTGIWKKRCFGWSVWKNQETGK